jgi:pimeloyl-ACP methyl ester carboxylesterase
LFVQGDGPTVVLLHGFGHSADAWRPVLNRFAQAGQSAVAVDLPGFGTAAAAAPGAWLPQGDRFVGAVIAAYSEQAPVVLVGNSLGAALTVRAAATPLRLPIQGIVATGTPGMGWAPLVRTALAGNGRVLIGVASLIGPMLIRAHGADMLLGHLLYGDRTMLDADVVRLLGAQAHDRRSIRELLARGALMKAEVDAEPATTGVTCPAVIVHGRRDRIVAVASSEGLHRAIPHSRLVILDRAGHCPQLDAPDTIVEFARGLSAASPGQSKPA